VNYLIFQIKRVAINKFAGIKISHYNSEASNKNEGSDAMRILLVEDDELLGQAVCHGLRHFGYVADWVKDGLAADNATRHERFDAIILDIGLPKLDGYAVLERLRNRGINTPVLILTARETVGDRIKGLDLGADDYLIKPFDLNELGARLRALIRRVSDRTTPLIVYGDLALDQTTRTLTYRGELISLPRREFLLLQILLENMGKVLSRDHLMQTLYGWEENVDSNTLEVHVHGLRKRFGNDFIRTIRGVGYLIEKIEK